MNFINVIILAKRLFLKIQIKADENPTFHICNHSERKY